MEEEVEIINIHSDKDYGVKWNSLVHEESEPVEVEDGQFIRSYTRKEKLADS
jgi:hypothetical protein